MSPLVLTSFTAVNALGRGVAAILRALQTGTSGLKPCDFEQAQIQTYTGAVPGLEEPVEGRLAPFDCRNNRLAWAALHQDDFLHHVKEAIGRYGPARIAVVLGTSTSGILETEHAYRRREPATGRLPSYHFQYTHNLYASADFVRRYFELEGPGLMISTACSSSAKVFAAASRMMALGLCDAAIVGGVDSLCLNTLYGFASLELLSTGPCRPCDAQRSGISIGEGAGFALLESPDRARGHSGVAFLGYGESADAYHMSTPRPDGAGAAFAMQQALRSADLQPQNVDYVNLHGTASQTNDAMEDKAVVQVLGADIPCSSTKGWTGHALGAAGITEAVIACLCIQHGFMPGCLNSRSLDPNFTSRVLLTNHAGPVRRVLSNSFGFGGSNCSLVFGTA